MIGRATPENIRAAAVADYRASGDPLAVVARRHGVSKTALSSWVNPRHKKRQRDVWSEAEVALTGGRWVNVRGVMRWEPFAGQPVDRQRRVEWEEAMFDEDEAREAHARYAYGHREPRIVMGERVYQRRKKRAQAARKAAA